MLDASTTASLVRVVEDRVAADSTGVLAISHDEGLLQRQVGRTVRLGSR